MLETALLGAVVTALVQWIKNEYSTSKVGTLFIVAVLSFVVAIVALLLQHFNLWSTFVSVVASATVIYAFIVQHFESTPDSVV